MEPEPHIDPNSTYSRPEWISSDISREEELCPTCFKAVGVESRYKLICALGKEKTGATVSELTDHLGLKQPTVTHHLQVLQSGDAVTVADRGRERVYTLNRNAHCFEDCKIPY
jgi:predicted transcriptional regulator